MSLSFAEIGVFMAISAKDKDIYKARARALEESNDLIDLFSEAIVRCGVVPKVGSYQEDYTLWSYKTESAMLPEYLRESNAHRDKLISLLEILQKEGSPSAEVVKLFQQAIVSRGDTLAELNALTEELCDPVTIQEFDVPEAVADDHGH